MGQPTRDSPSALTGATSQLVGPWTNHSCSTRDPTGELMGKTSIVPASTPAALMSRQENPWTSQGTDRQASVSTIKNTYGLADR